MSRASTGEPGRAGPAAGSGPAAGRRFGDRGSSPVELAILWPVILLLVFGSVQIATYFTARTVALSAAQLAVSAERRYGATPGAGPARAEAFLLNSGDWLRDWEVGDPVYTADSVEVTVTGTALSIIPGVEWRVSQTARGTLEQFTEVGP